MIGSEHSRLYGTWYSKYRYRVLRLRSVPLGKPRFVSRFLVFYNCIIVYPYCSATVQYCNALPGVRYYRRILGVRYLSNRLTSGHTANTNKTYGGKSSYAMYFMPYIVDSVVGFINDENMAPRDVSAPNGAQ